MYIDAPNAAQADAAAQCLQCSPGVASGVGSGHGGVGSGRSGDIDFIGRRDFQVKIRGFRVELTEIEGRIRAYPGVTDAAVVARYETFLRPEDKRWTPWVDAQQDKIRRALAHLEDEHLAELASVFDVAAIGVACALGYIDLRLPDLGWRERQPKLAAWYAEVSQRESMLKTAPSVA